MKQTPMIKQFLGFKRQYPDKIVLFRMGDFFETFGEDAKISSKILNITLTSRDKREDPTPMAGFPHHAINQYLPKLVKAGYCVVVVDQLESPKVAKGIVKRGVTRIVTPGTLEEDESSYTKNIYLVSLHKLKNTLGVGVIDISTGNLQVYDCEFTKSNIEKVLSLFDPAEILLIENEDINVSRYPVQFLEKEEYSDLIKEFYKVNSLNSLSLKSSSPSSICVGMILKYISETQKVKPEHISKPIFLKLDGSMYLDSSTIKNLDLIFNSATGSTEGSLLSILSEAKTNMGMRLLRNWILSPLLDFKEVNRRLEIVDYFVKNFELLDEIRNLLSSINDLERLVGKIGLARANARDYRALEHSLMKSQELYSKLSGLNDKYGLFSKNLFSDSEKKSLKRIVEKINEAIIENPPLLITEGGIINDGYNAKVDELRNISGNSKNWVREFALKEKERTGITNLKIAFNRVFGYYIEVSKANQNKVPEEYIRKQTLVNSERYITEELKEKEDEILNAEEKLSSLEFDLFEEFRLETLPYIKNIKTLAAEISYLDVLQGFAYCALCNDYIKPTVFNVGLKEKIINVEESRHPVIEAISEEEFVSNDILLDKNKRRMNILTGPNMSGKSTYIRQLALIVLMAQIGSFIPASSGDITMVDRIFTRVGASDDLIRGRSTFMVEMDEAANIVNNATENSLVILDEIGRGTSTYDGVSIAWALAEYLINNVKARTIFATHYHELLTLADSHGEFVTNLNVQVDEDDEKEEVVFLRKIIEGGTNRSYGIHVAKLAGLPEEVIERSKEILGSFEQTSMFSRKNMDVPISLPKEEKKEGEELKDVTSNQLDLFHNKNNYLFDEIRKLDINTLTPIEALNKIGDWKKRLS
jgi:DNA mismatch repair protein MutS